MTLDTQEQKKTFNKKWLWLILVAIGIFIAVSWQPYQKSLQAKEHFDQGMLLFENKGYEDALNEFSLAIEIKPDYAEAYYQRGLVYISSGEDDLGMQDFEQAISIQSSLAKRYNEEYANLNNIYGLRASNFYKDHQVAVNYFTRVIQINSEYENVYVLRGYSFFELGMYDEAISDLTIGLEKISRQISENSIAQIYLLRARAFDQKEDYLNAIDDYTHAIELSLLDVPTMFYLRGRAYYLIYHEEESLVDFNRALEISPNNALYLYARGKTYQELGQFDKALEDLERALSLCSDEDICMKAEQALGEIAE